MKLLWMIIAIIIMMTTTACGGGAEAESAPQNDSNENTASQTTSDTDTNSQTVMQINNPLPEQDYDDFTLGHAIELCNGIVVPFPATWDVDLPEGLGDDRCSLAFSNDELRFSVHIMPYDNPAAALDYESMSQTELFESFFAGHSTIAMNQAEPSEEITINANTTMRYEGITLKANSDDPDNTQILYIIDMSEEQTPIFAVLSARGLSEIMTSWGTQIEDWVNSITKDTTPDDMTYIYKEPVVRIDLPVETFATDASNYTIQINDDPDDDPIFLMITTPSIEGMDSNLIQFSIPEIPPAEGKTYSWVSNAEGPDEVNLRMRFSDESDSYFIFSRDATVTLSYDGYVINGEVGGNFYMSDDAAPLTEDFEIDLSFTNISRIP